jgi:hypothetical protein
MTAGVRKTGGYFLAFTKQRSLIETIGTRMTRIGRIFFAAVARPANSRFFLYPTEQQVKIAWLLWLIVVGETHNDGKKIENLEYLGK